eukprot:5670700-Pyramimonas_sp.AAC.1
MGFGGVSLWCQSQLCDFPIAGNARSTSRAYGRREPAPTGSRCARVPPLYCPTVSRGSLPDQAPEPTR